MKKIGIVSVVFNVLGVVGIVFIAIFLFDIVFSQNNKIALTLSYIDSYYYQEVDMEKCADSILVGGVSACTDKFSRFINKKDAKREEARKNGYVAIFSNEAGGNSVSVSGSESEETMERAKIINPSVFFLKLEDKIGYVKITGFIRPTKDDFEAAVSSLSQSGVKALVIDLRDNPGGITQSVVGIISFFKSDAKPVIYIKRRNQPEVGMLPDRKKRGVFKNLRVVVLANEWSASAAEIMSGWLKEDFGAIVVGKPTYGKDCGQEAFTFPDGSVLRLTTFHYLIGNKKISIGKVGVKPTIEISNEKDEDKQLEMAFKQAEKLLSK